MHLSPVGSKVLIDYETAIQFNVPRAGYAIDWDERRNMVRVDFPNGDNDWFYESEVTVID